MLKQFDSIKQLKSVSADQFVSLTRPVKAHLCKTNALQLLNNLFMIQAFHNGIDLSKLKLSKEATISTQADRQLLEKEFSAHVKEILGSLNNLVQDRNLDLFMEVLAEQTKNLAARLGKQGPIDKKVERAIKLELTERCLQL